MNYRLQSNLQAVDFFCSAGGVTCGFKKAGIDVLGGIDVDVNCKTTYELNNSAKFLCADVSSLEMESIGSFFKIHRNQDNLIFVGCSPCQYYSNIKTDKTKSIKTRLLLSDFQEFVEYYLPGYVFVENVPGFESKPRSPLSKFKKFLLKNGYVYDDGVVNAKHFGVPQNRRRYVLVATRVLKRIKLPIGDKNNLKTVKDAIGDYSIFTKIEAGKNDKTCFAHTSASLKEINLERIKRTPHDGGDRRVWNDNQDLQLECYKEHKGHYDVYGRMYWNKPSPAITTRFVSLSNGRYGHPEQDRAISIREGATLQTFPLDYVFYSESQGTIAKMIGNAVPPKLAMELSKAFKSKIEIING